MEEGIRFYSFVIAVGDAAFGVPLQNYTLNLVVELENVHGMFSIKNVRGLPKAAAPTIVIKNLRAH